MALAFSQVQEAKVFVSSESSRSQTLQNLLEDLLPHGQAAPVTGWFSVAERSQVHSPAGRAPGDDVSDWFAEACVSSLGRQGGNDLLQEHRAPLTVFSVEALLQVQWRAFCLPQEHLAWAAQTQLPSPEVLQQVEEGWTILTG